MESVATNLQQPQAVHRNVLVEFYPNINLMLCSCKSPTCPGGTFAFSRGHVPRHPLNPPFVQLEALPADFVRLLFDGMQLPGHDVLEIRPTMIT